MNRVISVAVYSFRINLSFKILPLDFWAVAVSFSTCNLFMPYLILHLSVCVFMSGYIEMHLNSHQGNSGLDFQTCEIYKTLVVYGFHVPAKLS